ncbi:MAG: hypothetical protein KUG82_13795 [Pseudomonadales bacterium]|nr:hypothetical protein [Pseudomonadales bacterium]
MKPLELASKYLEIFFGDGSVEPMIDLFQPNMVFEGPFFQGLSAREYVDSLKADPPSNSRYKILSSYETESSACVIYKFSKYDVSTTMVQQFEVSESKISKILLVFDTGVFT